MNEPTSLQLPIALPPGWSAEADPVYGTVITARTDSGALLGYVTVSEEYRSFELGQSRVRRRQPDIYKGHTWRKALYRDAVAALQAVWSS
jgi:hypothetical protein